MITSIIFDLDGLLADTERLHCMAYQDALRVYGAAVTDHEYAEHWVRSGRGITEWITDRGLTLDPIALRAHKSRCYLDLLRSELRPMEGALALLERLHSRKKLALASSSYPDAVEGVLAGLSSSLFPGNRHRFGCGAGQTRAGYLPFRGPTAWRGTVAMRGFGRRRKRRNCGKPRRHPLHRHTEPSYPPS